MYSTGFTVGGLLFTEFMALRDIVLDPNRSELLDLEAQENRLLAIKTLSARTRIVSELKARIDTVDPDFWQSFYSWNEKEQKLALFFIILKTYKIVLELHLEVAVVQFRVSGILKPYDISMRLDQWASQNQIIGSWSESTLEKINGQYRKALKDAGLYRGEKLTEPTGISNDFWQYFKNGNHSWFVQACFKQ